ncbi:hypothetical protein Tsubulata_021934 [Turnera subulata]|uniref:Late embryogenesis abundant protein LEA-2 subgroup domain-containing protein n=1 Tax=Turnera subulata TaxID=218843 RepID=A0A9Q0F240_9ROSI|nr:hypothetical protein Tsubulata_021934 [Turnera subulata]
MVHTKSDSSDMTSSSLAPSSPRSPKLPRAVYYVQSPSRDSHDDGDKSSSMQPSPTESPSHPSSYARHSRASSSSRVSGTYGPSSAAVAGGGPTSKKGLLLSKCEVIQEEGSDYFEYQYQKERRERRRCLVLMVLVGFVAGFSLLCLTLWGVSRPYKPRIRVQSITVDDFYFGEGSDLTGVPTKMLTMNCSLKMNIYNPATFFGIHVSAIPVNLMYLQLTVATGGLKRYYQQRKSHRTVFVNLKGTKVPLYGAGASFANSDDNGGVPMSLVFEVRSRGNIVGKLVKSRHRKRVSCSVSISSHGNGSFKFMKDSCTFR